MAGFAAAIALARCGAAGVLVDCLPARRPVQVEQHLGGGEGEGEGAGEGAAKGEGESAARGAPGESSTWSPVLLAKRRTRAIYGAYSLGVAISSSARHREAVEFGASGASVGCTTFQ